MKHFCTFGALLLLVVLAACEREPAISSNVEQLDRLARQYVDERRPGASRADRTDYSAEAFIREIEDQEQVLEQLLAIDPEGLSLEQDIDRRLLIGIVSSDVNTSLKQRRWETDAALYVPGERLGQLFEPAFAGSEKERTEQLSALLEELPGRLEQGRKNLKRPPKRFTEAAIFQSQSTLKSMREGRSRLPGLSDEIIGD